MKHLLRRSLSGCWLGVAVFLIFFSWCSAATDFSTAARAYKQQLAEKVLPYGYDTAIDWQRGGYVLADDAARKAPPATEKQIVTQARMVWGFAHVQRQGYLDPKRDYLKAATHGGWGEHYERDWRLITQPDGRIEVEVAGLKSANAHLHWMEALSELYDATKDADVKSSLAEALRLNATYFYAPDAGEACFHRHPDWSFVSDPKSAGLSYGHNVEFAWLMIRAEEVLDVPPSWAQCDAILAHALKYGYDHERGGLYHRGVDDRPATDTDKVWWSQSEIVAALADGLRHQPNPAYAKALEQLIGFLNAHQIDSKDGIWLDTVTADGKPKSTAKAHNSKANYHDVRALVKFSEAFGGKS